MLSLGSEFDWQNIVFKSKVLNCRIYSNLNNNSDFMLEIRGYLTLLIVKHHAQFISLVIHIEIFISNFLKSQSL